MQLRNHVNTYAVKRLSVTEAMQYIYDIKSELLLVRKNDFSLHKWSVGTAHLRTVEGTLLLGVATLTLKTASIEHWMWISLQWTVRIRKWFQMNDWPIREYEWAKYNEGRLTFLYFFTLSRGIWRSVFPWLHVVDQTLFAHSRLFRIISTLRDRRCHDEQETVVVVKRHYQGYE